jgi:hypothetical protein
VEEEAAHADGARAAARDNEAVRREEVVYGAPIISRAKSYQIRRAGKERERSEGGEAEEDAGRGVEAGHGHVAAGADGEGDLGGGQDAEDRAMVTIQFFAVSCGAMGWDGRQEVRTLFPVRWRASR